MTDPKTAKEAREELDRLNVQWSRDKFMSLVLSGNNEWIKLFLLAGMSPETSDRNGITALMWASGKGHTATASLLLQHGANVNQQTARGRTALMSAVYYGRIETLKVLIENAADTCLKDSEGKTAYQWSLERKQTTISNILKKR